MKGTYALNERNLLMKHKRYRRILSPLRALCAVLCAVSLLLALGACAPAETVMNWFGGKWVDDKPYENYKMSKFIKLGAYKGVEAEFITLEEYLGLVFAEYGAPLGISDDSAKTKIALGDLVYFDFEGSAPGISEDAKEGMKGTTLLFIGSGNFIPEFKDESGKVVKRGFEDQMIDQARDKEFTVDVRFPDPYQGSEELSGKDVTFKCKVYKIGDESGEITDEGVNSLTGGAFATRADFEDRFREDAIGYNRNLAFDAAFDNATVVKLPPKEQKYWDERLADIAAGQGLGAEEFAQYSGFENAAAYRDEQVVCELFLYAVAQKEGITISDEEVKAQVAELRAGGYEGTEAELYSEFGGKGYLLRYLTREKVTTFIFENAKGVPVEP